MNTALFINGVYEVVLENILNQQEKAPSLVSYLQPYKRQVIQMLKKASPSTVTPINIYLSTTKELNKVVYTAKIVRWENKREIEEGRRLEVINHLKKYQPEETNLFNSHESINLISIIGLKRTRSNFNIEVLKKKSDGKVLKHRTRAGGWSEVYEVTEIFHDPIVKEDDYQMSKNKAIATALKSSSTARKQRLKNAVKIPSKISILSSGFNRNPDVIAEVRNRANERCEACGNPAPFIRKSDGTPYLEVHHIIPLSKGGEDTIENAVALCPNCHRKVHYGA